MKNISAFVLAVTIMTPTTWAEVPNEMATKATRSVVPSTTFAPRVVGLDGLYKFSKNTEVIPLTFILNGEAEDNIGGVSLDMNKDETIAIEYMYDGKILMTLRLAAEEAGKVAEQLIITQEEMNELGLEMTSTGGVDELMARYSGYEDTLVAGRPRLKARKHKARLEGSQRGGRGFGRDASGRIRGGGGNCVAVVKSLTGFSGTAGNGKGMAYALERRGWKNVGIGHRSRGTVCSWVGGSHGLGHVGYFDGTCFQPTYGGNCGSPGKNYRMVKCVARR